MCAFKNKVFCYDVQYGKELNIAFLNSLVQI